mgnify:FL=1
MGLLSAIRVLGTLPIIRCAPGGAAEMCAQSLYTALCDNCTPRGPAYSLFTDCLVSNTNSSSDYSSTAGAISNRPLLLIFDRASDLTPPLMHSESYQALIDDLLDHKLNRVNVDLSMKDGTKAKKTYDVNTTTDLFFAKYAGSSFPDAVEANETELGEVSTQENDIKSRSSMGAAAGGGAGGQAGDVLGKDIESLPEILARKANLEAHTNILQALMKSIATREVHTYTQVEGVMKMAEVLELLEDGSKGSIADKARLLVLALSQLAGTGVPMVTPEFKSAHGADVTTFAIDNEYEDGFISGAIGVLKAQQQAEGKTADAPLDYTEINDILGAMCFIKQCLSLSSPLDYMRPSGGGTGRSDAFSSLLSSASSHITSQASNLLAKATTFFSRFNPLLVTKIVDSLAEGRSCPENETYCCLDPRSKLMNTNQHDIGAYKTMRFPDVIVFTLGGGCYNEYYNIMELVKHKLSASGGGNSNTPVLQNTSLNSGTSYFPRNLMYGCTELVSGEKFLGQLKQLGSKPPATTGSGTTASK